MRGIFANIPLPKVEHPTFNDLPVEIVMMIINSGVSPLWPKYPDERKDHANWQLVNSEYFYPTQASS